MTSTPLRAPNYGMCALVAVVIVVGLGFLLQPDVGSRPAAPRMLCLNNLRDISLALQNYQTQYGCLPPAVATDAAGTELYSWRFLAFPFLDLGGSFDYAHLDEPWNSSHNWEVGKHSYGVFKCSESSADSPYTNYVGVRGKHTLWPEEGVGSLKDVADGASQTIVIVESVNTGFYPTQPGDLHFDRLPPGINSAGAGGVSSAHRRGANVVFADGSARFLSRNIDAEVLRALLTTNGAEKLPVGWDSDQQ